MRAIPLSIQLSILLVPILLSATPYFDGSVRYQYQSGNQKVTLTHQRISNSSDQNTTGTIKVSLWATEFEYSGGNIEGKRIASYKLDGLQPGQYWKEMSKTLQAAPPPYEDYFYMTMTIEEYTHDGYVIQDWIAFDNPAYLSIPTPQKRQAPPAAKLLSISGPYRWQTYPEENILEIDTGKISHTRNGNTGSLRITVWATQNRYSGGRINGYILGYVQKQALKKGYVYNKISSSVPYSPPPLGKFYYITIALSEYDGSEYVIRDYHTFDNGSWF